MPKSKKNLYIIASAAFVLIIAAIYFLFIFQKSPQSRGIDRSAFETKPISDIEIANRPYVTLTPTATGAEIIISMENMTDFDNIEYELTYLADNPQIPGEKIKRGATGVDIDTKSAKYKKSILLGTASRGVSNPDKGIEDGRLILHLFKGSTEYQSETPWYLLEAGLSTKEVATPSGELAVTLPSLTKDYFILLAETVGVPPNGEFNIKNVQLPVYGIFSIIPKFTPQAELSIKTTTNDAQIHAFNLQEEKWSEVETVSNGSMLSAKIDNFATFVIVSQQ